MNWRYTAKWVPSGKWGKLFDWHFVPGYYRITIGARGFYISRTGGWHIRYISGRWRMIA